MRLVCPNCDTAYEVDPALLTPEGRAVECSTCGHGWTASAEVPRPALDVSVRTILREEAEREAMLRRGQSPQAAEVRTGPAAVPPSPPSSPAESPATPGRSGESAFADAGEERHAIPPSHSDQSGQHPGLSDRAERSDRTPATQVRLERASEERPEEDVGARAQSGIGHARAESDGGANGDLPWPSGYGKAAVGSPEPLHPAGGDVRPLRFVTTRPERVPRPAEPLGESRARPLGHVTSVRSSEAMRERPVRSPADARSARHEADARAKTRPGSEPANGGRTAAMRPQPERPSPTGRELAPLGPLQVAEPPAPKPPRRGFRRGLLSTLAIVLVALGAYIYAPALAEALPAAEPAFASYVTGANAVRAEILSALDAAEGVVRPFLARLTS